MRTINIHFAAILAIILTACGSGTVPDSPESGTSQGVPVEIVTGMSFPKMEFAATRAMGEQPSIDDLRNNLKVNLFVFDPSGVMLQFIGPEDVRIINIDEASKRVYFKVSNIYSSDSPRRLHFVITSASDLRAISGGEYISAMASETTVMPALVVGDGTDAYWGIKELDAITDNMQLTVKLIRNFVKLTVKSSAPQSTFRLLGYTVVNRPGHGTIAPYIYRDHLFATFLDANNQLISYDEIIEQGYYGVNPSGGDQSMTCVTEAEVSRALSESESLLASGTDAPCYIYERSQSAIVSAGNDVMVTYMIVVGEYQGKRCYYKIDIGRDKDGKFGFYDLLRNFQYTVDITEVGGEGAPTLQDAMNGAAHNNLSTSVVTRDLFSIGYDGDKIEVGSTRVIFTEKTTDYSLRFRYTVGSGESFDASKLRIYDVSDESKEYDMSGVTASAGKAISLPGAVIETASVTREGTSTDAWYELRISTKDIPSDSRRLEQNIRIYYAGGTAGLGRTVTFIMRRPWEFADVSATSPGAALQSQFSLSFTLPTGLSESQFPLVITFESDKQNIYAVNGSDLVVGYGSSGFPGATTDHVIYYELRLEWDNYQTLAGNPCAVLFRMNTTSADDRAYNTSGIDAAGLTGRTANNGSAGFCLRIANKGRKYIQPIYVNVSR